MDGVATVVIARSGVGLQRSRCVVQGGAGEMLLGLGSPAARSAVAGITGPAAKGGIHGFEHSGSRSAVWRAASLLRRRPRRCPAGRCIPYSELVGGIVHVGAGFLMNALIQTELRRAVVIQRRWQRRRRENLHTR